MNLHPLEARRIRDLGLDYMIAKKLTRAALRSFDLGFDESLKLDLDQSTSDAALTERVGFRARSNLSFMEKRMPDVAPRLRTAYDAFMAAAQHALDAAVDAFVAAVGALVLNLEGDHPFALGKAFELQISPRADSLLGMLALARKGLQILRTGDRVITLAAPLRPRPEVPPPRGWDAAGPDAVELTEILDVIDPWAAKTRAALRTALADLAPRVRIRGVHMIDLVSEADDRRWAVAVTEAVREVDPPRFWEVVDRFGEYHRAAAARRLNEVLDGIADPVAIARRVAEPSANQPGDFDFNMAQACGVPRIRPCYVIGIRWFSGGGLVQDVRAAIEALTAARGK